MARSLLSRMAAPVALGLLTLGLSCGEQRQQPQVCIGHGARDQGPGSVTDMSCPPAVTRLVLDPIYPTSQQEPPRFEGCPLASTLPVTSQGESFIAVAASDGVVHFLVPGTAEEAFQVALPAVDDLQPHLVSTPVVLGDLMVIAYNRRTSSQRRMRQHVAVIDLEARALHEGYPELELSASMPGNAGSPVEFYPPNTLNRSTLMHGPKADGGLGFVYVTFGNTRDVQPWHGWIFEIDLDAWGERGAPKAVSGVLLTTPETDCFPKGQSGSYELSCGGGVWAPGGSLVLPPRKGSDWPFELVIPTGNGILDVTRKDYANSLLRTTAGLAFEAGCDLEKCTPFDVLNPTEACMKSCQNLFIPRIPAGEPGLDVQDGTCDGMSFLECYKSHDWDLGANTPAPVTLADGRVVLVVPAKDGAVYLVDHEHLGTLHHRLPVITPCGTATDRCDLNWAGMMVTQPAIVDVDGVKVALISTFVTDRSHPAGLVALQVGLDEKGQPRLTRLWEAPSFDSPEAIQRFRRHPTRVAVHTVENDDGTKEPYAFVVDVPGRDGSGLPTGRGMIFAVRVRTGEIVQQMELAGAGWRFTRPLVHDGVLYVNSCMNDDGPAMLEAFRLTEQRQP